MKIGIIGCGVISNTYIKEIKRLYSDIIEIKAVAARHIQNAERTAHKYKIEVFCTPEELLQDKEIELVINLTPPDQHFQVNMDILNAGKHLFTEKPIALYYEEARKILDTAKEHGLYVGAAPDVFLTAPQQNSRLAIESGLIGKPMYATINMIRYGIEHWHANPFFYYKFGGGPLYDMAPYYLSALINLFGPIASVFACQRTGFEKRLISSQPHRGEYIDVEVPTHYSGVLEMENGVLVSMNMTFDIYHSNLPMMEVYGELGTITIPDPNMTAGIPKIFCRDKELKPTGKNIHRVNAPDQYHSVARYTRGAGVAEMVTAIQKGVINRANGEIEAHVIEVVEKLILSSETGNKYRIESKCAQPQMMEA